MSSQHLHTAYACPSGANNGVLAPSDVAIPSQPQLKEPLFTMERKNVNIMPSAPSIISSSHPSSSSNLPVGLPLARFPIAPLLPEFNPRLTRREHRGPVVSYDG